MQWLNNSGVSLVQVLAFVVAICSAGCSGGGSGATCPSDSSLSYESFGEDFFARYCTTCHASALNGAARLSAPSDVNFDTVELIQSQIASIDEQAAAGPDGVNTAMPNAGARPSDEERRQLGEWLACGAP